MCLALYGLRMFSHKPVVVRLWIFSLPILAATLVGVTGEPVALTGSVPGVLSFDYF